jgi:putative phosphonate catabolism associated alcohol dehydrogenase
MQSIPQSKRPAFTVTQGAAAVFHGPGEPMTVENYPVPELGHGEILVRVTCTTICGSDLHTVRGRRSGPCPCVLGHEIVGTIAAFGPDAPRVDLDGAPLELGDRVTWTLTAACGECFFCQHGLPQKCETTFKYGHSSLDAGRVFSGGYAEYCLLVPGTGILRLPATLADPLAATANCAASTVAAAVRMLAATVQIRGGTVLVLGAGALGITACAMLREAGTREVWACDLDPDRADRALAFGATRALSPAELEAAATGRGMDAALEFTGSSVAVAAGIRALRIGGTAVLAGTVLPSPMVDLDPEQVVRRMLTIRGLHNYASEDLVSAVRFLDRAQARYPFSTLVGEIYPLQAINEALAAAGRATGYRVAVVPTLS